MSSLLHMNGHTSQKIIIQNLCDSSYYGKTFSYIFRPREISIGNFDFFCVSVIVYDKHFGKNSKYHSGRTGKGPKSNWIRYLFLYRTVKRICNRLCHNCVFLFIFIFFECVNSLKTYPWIYLMFENGSIIMRNNWE